MATKRMLSWLIAASLTLSLLPAAALAAEDTGSQNSIPAAAEGLPSLPDSVPAEAVDQDAAAELSEEDRSDVNASKQEVIGAVEDHNQEIEARENAFQETVREIQDALNAAVNTADGAYSKDFQTALESFQTAIDGFNTAVDAKAEVVVNGEKKEMTLQELLDFANGAEVIEAPEAPGASEAPEASDTPAAGEDNDVIAQLERAAREAAEAARKAQEAAEAAASGAAGAEAAAAKAAERAEAAKTAQKLVENCKTAKQAIEDAVTALQTAAAANKDAIETAIQQAESAYAGEKASAEALPTPGDDGSSQTYAQQGSAAAERLQALRDQQQKLIDLSAQLTAAQSALAAAQSARTDAVNKNTEISNITGAYGAEFAGKNLGSAQTSAQQAVEDLNAAKTFQQEAADIRTELENLPEDRPTLSEQDRQKLSEWKDSYGKADEVSSYLSGAFASSYVDRDKNGGDTGSTGAEWLDAEADGSHGTNKPTRREVLNAYLTMSPADYDNWWQNRKGDLGIISTFQGKDPIRTMLDSYDPSMAGSGLRDLMAMLGNSTDPDARPTGVNSSLASDIACKNDAAYTSALASAKTALAAAGGATPSQLLGASAANAEVNSQNRAELNRLVSAFKEKYQDHSTLNRHYTDESFKTAAGMTAVITASDAASSQSYADAISKVNDNLGLVAANVKLDSSAANASLEAIQRKFTALQTQQNTLKDAIAELNGGEKTDGTAVEKGLLEKASDAAGSYQTAYQAYTDEAGRQQAAAARVNGLKAAASQALEELKALNLKLNAPDFSKTLDTEAIQKLKDEIAAKTNALNTYTSALQEASDKLARQTEKTEEAKKAAEEAQKEADKALEEAKGKAEEAKKAAEEAAQKAQEAQKALDKAKDDAAKEAAEEAAKRAQQEAEEAARLAEELRRALEALQNGDDDATAIEDGVVPLAGLIDRQTLVSCLYTHESSPDGVDAEGEYTLALAWGVAKDVVDEEDDPEEVVTVAILCDVMTRYAKLLNRTFTVEIPGEEDDIVMNCDEILAEFFGE